MNRVDELISKGKLKRAVISKVYSTFERGMDLREMADYKETYSKNGAEVLISDVKKAIEEISLHINLL